MNWRTFWDGLAQSGWLSDLGRDRSLELQESLEGSQDDDSLPLWVHLADLSFDVECIFESEEGPGPYVLVLQRYAEASRNHFRPRELHDELDPIARTATVTFEHGDRSYRCEIPWHDDFFRDEVHDLVNQALADAAVEQRFVFLPADESGNLNLALVRPEVLRMASARAEFSNQ